VTLTVQPLPPGPSSSLAQRAISLFKSRIRILCHPQDILLISQQLSQEIEFQDIVNPVCTFSCNSKPRTPMGQQSTFSYIGDFPIRKSEYVMSRVLDTTKSLTPNSDSMCRLGSSNFELRYIATCTLLESSGPTLPCPLQDFTDRESTKQVFFVVRNPEMPNTETPKSNFSGSCATCPCPDQRFPLNREIATWNFNVHETFTLPNAKCRIPI